MVNERDLCGPLAELILQPFVASPPLTADWLKGLSAMRPHPLLRTGGEGQGYMIYTPLSQVAARSRSGGGGEELLPFTTSSCLAGCEARLQQP